MSIIASGIIISLIVLSVYPVTVAVLVELFNSKVNPFCVVVVWALIVVVHNAMIIAVKKKDLDTAVFIILYFRGYVSFL